MLNNTDFPKRLEKIMDYYGLSASALAEEIAFNRSTISHLVSGRNKPSLEFVMKLLQKFPELEMDWLVLGKGHFPSILSPETKHPETKEVRKKSNPTQVPTPVADLFSNTGNGTNLPKATVSGKKTIERIVIFYSDGTFSLYEQ